MERHERHERHERFENFENFENFEQEPTHTINKGDDMIEKNQVDRALGWLEKGLQIVERYKLKTIFKAFFIITLIVIFISFLKNPTWIFAKYDEWKKKEHTAALELRMANSEKLHVSSEKLLYKVGADRVMILELHNGLENANGLPFSKCSATYEALELNVSPIANQYQSVNLSLMPFVNEVFRKGYWCGNVDEIAEIDRGLYYKMKSNGTEHFACCLIEGVDKPLALLFVSFKDPVDSTSHDCAFIRENVRHIALEQALLLELNKYHTVK